MRAKEYLVLLRARDDALALTTMLFADEVRSRRDVDAATQKSHKPTKKQVDAAVAVIEELSTEWDPSSHKDRYRNRLKRVVDQKRRGKTVKAPEPQAEPEAAPDLMAALERTLAEMKQSGDGKREKQETR
jgi:DNA end-binding protein Ku